MVVRLSLLLPISLLIAGCSSDEAPAADPKELAPVVAPVAVVPGVTKIGSVNLAGAHLDDDVATTTAPTAMNPKHESRNLEILLRSSPAGAMAAVDGVAIGQTPILWEGDFTGREREFTFALAGHTTARYRFVPTSNGVVHGRLEEVILNVPGGTPNAPKTNDATNAPQRVPPVPSKIPPPPTAPFAGPDAAGADAASSAAPF
jgi:hypothetical protein